MGHRIGCKDCGDMWTSAKDVRESCKGYAEWLVDGKYDDFIPGGYETTGESAFELDERSGRWVRMPYPKYE